MSAMRVVMQSLMESSMSNVAEYGFIGRWGFTDAPPDDVLEKTPCPSLGELPVLLALRPSAEFNLGLNAPADGEGPLDDTGIRL